MSAPNSPPWLPPHFVAQVAAKSEEDFLAEWRGVAFFLVELADGAASLAQGLAKSSQLIPDERPDGKTSTLDFATVQIDTAALADLLRQDGGTPAGNEQIPATMLAKPYFLVPLRKRAPGADAFASHISVGRTQNHDLVLRDGSVSKFHGWFEYTEEGHVFVSDAGSKNKTRVNGEVLGDDPVSVAPGACVEFGKVRGVLCMPCALWDVLARAGAR